MLSFADEGCGIPETDHEKIFEPYFTTKEVGTGLGLASTYAIIKNHGGKIFVASSPGKGATFTIYLPSLKTAPENRTNTDATGIGPRDAATVLVMDDEEMIRDLARMTLGKMGYRVTTCRDGKEAIDLYKSAKESGTPFSVVIMDLTIPGSMGGVEAAKHILAYDPGAMLIVSSGYSDDPVMANYREYGFCAAIEKPYRSEDVARVINCGNKSNLSVPAQR
jgi:CheY-like chemotaxis protein